MSFNPDPAKQARVVTFSSNRIKASHLPLNFNDYQINVEKCHEHLDLIFVEKLTFVEPVREAIAKAKRGIGIIHFLAKYASRDAIDQMHKLYARTYLDYGNIIYLDQSKLLSHKLESI